MKPYPRNIPVDTGSNTLSALRLQRSSRSGAQVLLPSGGAATSPMANPSTHMSRMRLLDIIESALRIVEETEEEEEEIAGGALSEGGTRQYFERPSGGAPPAA